MMMERVVLQTEFNELLQAVQTIIHGHGLDLEQIVIRDVNTEPTWVGPALCKTLSTDPRRGNRSGKILSVRYCVANKILFQQDAPFQPNSTYRVSDKEINKILYAKWWQ